MRRKGFRFAMALPHEPDADLHRFLSSEEQNRHNPWPETVPTVPPDDPDDDELAYPSCQPLVKAMYIPTTKSRNLWEAITEDHAPLRELILVLHEFAHAWLNCTPAKDVARIYLAQAYHLLDELFDFPINASKKRIREKLDELDRMNEGLEEVCEQIRLAEELLVTAYTFYRVENQVTNYPERSQEKEALDGLQKEWKSKQSTNFQQLYDDFKKVAHLVANSQNIPRGDVLMLVGWFLQPIHEAGGQPKVGNSEERCQKLADAVRNMNNTMQLCEWLLREVVKDTELHIEGGRFISKLLSVKNDRLIQFEFEAVCPVIFFTSEINGDWYIIPALASGKREFIELLYFEAFRQQINQRIGIRCPFLKTKGKGECICAGHPNQERCPLRLAHWAMEGKLGNGKWTDLPYPCNRRSC
jgi:hypothetical protein